MVAIMLAAVLVGMVIFQFASIAESPAAPAAGGAAGAHAKPETKPATDQSRDPMSLTTEQASPAGKAGVIGKQRSVPERLGTAGQTFTHAVDQSGNVLLEAGRADRQDPNGKARLHPGTLSIVDPDMGKAQEIRSKRDSHDGTQTTFATLDQDHAVWIEERSTQLALSDWTMYAANRATGKISKIARVHAIDDRGTKPSVPGHTVPSLHDGQVYWAEARANAEPGRPPVVNVYAKRLESSEPTKLVARNAIMPAATDGQLYYATFDGENANANRYAIHRKSLETGRTELVERANGTQVQSLAAYGDTVAWSTMNGTVKAYTADRPVAKIDGKGELLGWLSAGPGTIGFSDNGDSAGRNYLLDLRSGRLFNLGAAPGLAKVMIGGSDVLWAMPSAGPAADQHQVWQRADLRP